MQQSPRKRPHGPRHEDRLVNGTTVEAAPVLAPEPKHVIGVPPPAADPFPPEKNTPVNPEPVFRRMPEMERADLLRELGRDPFIGIDAEDPRGRRLLEGAVLLRPVPLPFLREPSDARGPAGP